MSQADSGIGSRIKMLDLDKPKKKKIDFGFVTVFLGDGKLKKNDTWMFLKGNGKCEELRLMKFFFK